MNVLVVAAHPDDEVLGAGGTTARLSSEGATVSTLILGEGATSRGSRREEVPSATVEELGLQAQRAGEVLGVEQVMLGGLPDNRFDSVDLLDIVKVVEQSIAEVEPSLLLAQHGGDVNVDHRRTFEAVLAATRPQPGSPLRSVLAFEVNSSTEWAFQHFSPTFRPSIFYDVTDHLHRKIEALRCYEGELRDWPHPRSVEAVTAVARARGAAVGVRAAEAFAVVRELR